MADMLLTQHLLETKYTSLFHNKNNTQQAKQEILYHFSKEPASSGFSQICLLLTPVTGITAYIVCNNFPLLGITIISRRSSFFPV